jgi:hypothetical protein
VNTNAPHPEPPPRLTAKPKPVISADLIKPILKAVGSVDEAAIAARLAALRAKYPTASPDQLAEMLTAAKCWQTGAIGTEIAEHATQRLLQKSLVRAIPVIGVGASAGTNILFTYVIGRRARSYFRLGPEAVDEWGESLRAI